MTQKTKQILLEIYTWDELTGYRQKVTETHTDITETEKRIFLHKLKTCVVGWQIKQDGVVHSEWWDKKARKNYATSEDYPDNPSRVWLDRAEQSVGHKY